LQIPRINNTNYPYTDDDNADPIDAEVDDDVKHIIKNKTNSVTTINDPLASLGSDKFYFVAGNTKLRDCFENPGIILKEIISYARMFNPVPALNKGKKVGGGSSFPGTSVGGSHGIGMTAGFASKPPAFDDVYLEKYKEDDELEDDKENISKKVTEN
jgi:hypothetical protein